jgi:ribosomal protein S18 acetylase RimI-like enzyme
MLTIDHIRDLSPPDRQAIIGPLNEFTRNQGFVWNPQPLCLALRNSAGQIVGGLIGDMMWGWLHIEILAVAELYRRQGWGHRLLAGAESLSRAAGCHHAWLDTFSFQARPFYEKLGYQVFGELPDYPAGQKRFFLTKTLSLDASSLAKPVSEPIMPCD